jgi:hypothetical protein
LLIAKHTILVAVLIEPEMLVSNYKLLVEVILVQLLLDVHISLLHHFALLIKLIHHVLLPQQLQLVKQYILEVEITALLVVINSRLDALSMEPQPVPLELVLITQVHLITQIATLG